MSNPHKELGQFLRRARADRNPQETGLLPDDRVRRVAGLRREEVALLAGVSTDYYTRLEQGRRIVPSRQVLDAIAKALTLDDAERAYLHQLARTSDAPAPRRRAAVQRVRPALRQLLDSLSAQPALILGHRTDILATNTLARTLFADFEAMPAKHRNYARWMLLSDEAHSLFIDWEEQARNAVEALRLDAAANPDDQGTQQLVGELSMISPEFRNWWSQHRVHQRTHGTKHLDHPIVGNLEIHFETLSLPGDQHQTLYIYTTEPGTSSHEALNLLMSETHTMPPSPTRHSS
ncbi:transcriptional regulator [Corynebacterium sp. CNJ-954]|uniref:helix-turn-helix transcriptional regulator n=1 Tax=Corynebacterium sp. CNJ-954 TaxID=1904962 RepID=UPI000966C493|nr:helix-turn-helix transcriptional regulator [Corynebacterium sp. CNJ-954]OLT53283.1 transcriptional regulator [Corynebacterium sp. CNJ-954]